MKLKLLAISAAALASAGVHAQSSVTLYGVADVGIEYVNNSSGTGKGTGDRGGVARMQSGNMSGSRWGLRGVEDLGQGLKGVFVLENGFTIDDGKDDGRLFGRQAFVGLQGGFGSLTLGRQETPVYDFALKYDPMALAGRYSLLSQDAGFSSRADNAIKYRGTFGGLTASALYSFGYDGNGEIPGDSRKGREYAFGLNYESGPFGVGAVYDQRQVDTAKSGVGDIKLQRAALAGSYAFGPAKAYVGYRWARLSGDVAGFGIGARSNLWWAGLGYQLTPALSLTGTVSYQDFNRTKADPWLFVASADYALSKRTDACFNVAYALNRADGGQRIASNLGVGGFGETSFTSNASKRNQFGAVVGIRHKF